MGLKCKGTHNLFNITDLIDTDSNECISFKPTTDTKPPQSADGTPCDKNKICDNGQCIAREKPEKLTSCPGSLINGEFVECNNHGVCNSENHCHCECGYAPPFCIYRGEGGSLDSGTECPNDFWLLLILLLILMFLVVPAALTLILR